MGRPSIDGSLAPPLCPLSRVSSPPPKNPPEVGQPVRAGARAESALLRPLDSQLLQIPPHVVALHPAPPGHLAHVALSRVQQAPEIVLLEGGDRRALGLREGGGGAGDLAARGLGEDGLERTGV